jgi:hypothetical protein
MTASVHCKQNFGAGGFLLSPYGLAALSTLVFLIAWLTPPGYYTDVVGEKDLVFLDPTALVFFLVCAAAFVTGVAAIDFLFPRPTLAMSKVQMRTSPLLFLSVPLILCSLITIEAIALLLRNNPTVLDLILAAQGFQVKENLDVHQPLGLASIWLLGVCWWASWRREQLTFPALWQRRLVSCFIVFGLTLVLAYAALKLGRGEFMPVLAGTIILYLIRQGVRSALSSRRLLRFSLVSAALLAVTFLLFSAARGSEDLLPELVRYSTASYNRMAALLSGRLHYPHAGTGVYFSSFLSFNSSFNQLIPLREVFHWPTFEDVWASEFTSTWQAGLDGYIIWSGTFGYLFSDFGWFAPLVVMMQGLLCGWLWRSIRRGGISGIILYPWVAFCILFWFGTNFFFDTKMVVLALAAFVLQGYERLGRARYSSTAAI